MTMAPSGGSDSAIFRATLVLPLPVPPAIPMTSGLSGDAIALRHRSRVALVRLAFQQDCRNNFPLSLPLPHDVRDCKNLTGGAWRPTTRGRTLEVKSPYTGRVIGTVGLSDPGDVAATVAAASAAFPAWAATPIKERVVPLRRFHELVMRHAPDLANTVALESGKTPAEALAGIQRGLEVVDYALSLPNLDDGAALEVSRGVTCEARREPLGVVAGITPFNFPAMVPMWMFPIAMTLGNAFVLKPSERVPLAACRLGELMTDAGYAPGLFSVVHG